MQATDNVIIELENRVLMRELYKYVVLHENGKVFLGYSKEAIESILANRMNAGRLIFHRDARGQIDGVLLWYRFQPGWGKDQFIAGEDDPEGKEIFICAAFADNDKARRVGILRLIATEPDVLHLRLSMLRNRKSGKISARIDQKTLARLLK